MKSLRRLYLILGVIAVLSPGAMMAGDLAKPVGAVERARGDTTARSGDAVRPLAEGGGVRFEDVLRTGGASRLMVKFIDGTGLSLGDSSELTIDDLVYEPGQRGRAVLRLAQGVFRLASGQVNKVPGGSLTVVTPLATIGARGTDFWGEQSADALLIALLDDGELTIATAEGVVTLTEPLSAVRFEKGRPPGGTFTLTPQQLQEAMATVAW